jgi:transposase
MLVRPEPIRPVPKETVRVAKAAFPKGNLYMKMRDELGAIVDDEDFACLLSTCDYAVLAPWKLALLTVMQFAEGLLDRQAAEAVSARIDRNLYEIVKRQKRRLTLYRPASSPTGR